jgi:hypothetical protein
MTQIVLDANLADRLRTLQQAVELCDPSGNVLGRFRPLIDLSEWEPGSPDITEEELQRRMNANEKRYSIAEVFAHLEKL